MRHNALSFGKRLAAPLLALLAVLLAWGGQAALPAQAHGNHTPKVVVGYFIEWGIYGRNYLVRDVARSGSAEKLTHINYAFGNVTPASSTPGAPVVCKLGDVWADYQKTWTAEESVDGQPVLWGEPLRGNFQQLRALKAQHPHLKLLISLGGWSWSAHFSNAALTAESRAALVSSCIDLFITGNLPADADAGGPGAAAGLFDGIDIDWEYPAVCGNTCGPEVARPEDTRNFTLLLEEFRRQLDAAGQRDGKDYLLTIANSASPSTFTKTELNKIHHSLDFINVMTYDFYGGWSTRSNFQSALYPTHDDPDRAKRLNVEDVVQLYLRKGVPREKLVVGLPFYGHGWVGVASTNNGLYQSTSGAAPATYEAGTEDYKVLKARLAAGEFTRYFHRKAQNAWLYSPTTQTFWTYDDPQTIAAKVEFVNRKRLGGVMFWELSGDTTDGELIDAIHTALDDR